MRLLRALRCRIDGHVEPDDWAADRWATCVRCGELFDVVEQRDLRREAQTF